MSLDDFAIETFLHALNDLSGVLDKAEAHAAAKGIDPAIFVQARLAPDMYPLATQVWIACRFALHTPTILAGRTPAELEGEDRTLDDLKTRIASTIAKLQAFDPAEFEGADEKQLTLPLVDDLELHISGLAFLRDWALPHFYFHVVTAYDILRHHGVELSKRDFMAHVMPLIRRRGSGAA